jgi:hypothetical protein
VTPPPTINVNLKRCTCIKAYGPNIVEHSDTCPATPTINVNLTPCDCRYRVGPYSAHLLACAAASPVLIPCPIPPKVEFTVRLGECDCPGNFGMGKTGPDVEHTRSCPARPVKVSCTIGGDGTWAGSEALTCDNAERRDGLFPVDPEAVLAACRARWEIVKALVTQADCVPPMGCLSQEQWVRVAPLVSQRDAVFDALARKVAAEQASVEATHAFEDALGTVRSAVPTPASEYMLGNYVARLIEQVGVLP